MMTMNDDWLIDDDGMMAEDDGKDYDDERWWSGGWRWLKRWCAIMTMEWWLKMAVDMMI